MAMGEDGADGEWVEKIGGNEKSCWGQVFRLWSDSGLLLPIHDMHTAHSAIMC